METLLRVMHPVFIQYNWKMINDNNNNITKYKNSDPYDEFIIEIPQETSQPINVVVPIKDIPYKNTFHNLNEVVAYLNMHLSYYAETKTRPQQLQQ